MNTMTVKNFTTNEHKELKEAGISHNTAFQEVLALYEEAFGALRTAPDDLETTDKAAYRALTDAYDAAYDALIALLDAHTLHRVCAEVAAARHRQARHTPQQAATPKRSGQDATGQANRLADRKSRQAFFTVRQDFRAFRLDYYAHGKGVAVQCLPEAFDTIFDLFEGWPRIMEWVRAHKQRSVSLCIDGKDMTPLIYAEIDHASGEIQSTEDNIKWIVAAKKG